MSLEKRNELFDVEYITSKDKRNINMVAPIVVMSSRTILQLMNFPEWNDLMYGF